MLLMHKPITWADFTQNGEHHLNRLCRNRRGDYIPVYIGDDAANPFAGALLSLPAFRLLSEDADDRLYAFVRRFFGPNAETEQAKAGVTVNWNEALQNGAAEQILSVRSGLAAEDVKYMYFMGSDGYRGVFVIYSHAADITPILDTMNRKKVIILSKDNDFLEQFVGADTRPKEDIEAFGKIPTKYAELSA